MAETIIALGSNLGDRHRHLRHAKVRLQSIAGEPLIASSLYETEPIGPSEFYFLNAVLRMNTHLSPADLLRNLKAFELEEGREPDPPKWSARILDLDLIDYGNRHIRTPRLVLPHPEYHKRLFVLEPLREIYPDWIDPASQTPIDTLISQADKMEIIKTSLKW